MARLAAIDCGTNSIRLLIADVTREENGSLNIVELQRTMKIVRLGEGVDATGAFHDAALDRVKQALGEFVGDMRAAGVQDVRMVATSATRDASNRERFFAITSALLGQLKKGAVAEVISGEEEAALSFHGAMSDFASAATGPVVVIDLGGGSTEFVVGTPAGEILGSHSANMGCVRITERIMRTDPPTDTEAEIAADFVAEKLQQVRTIVPLHKATLAVGCAGTFTTLSALAQGLESYDPRAIHGSTLKFSPLRQLTAAVRKQSSAQRASNPVIHPGRADVIGSGTVVVDGIMEELERTADIHQFTISEKDILDGIILSLAARNTL